MSISDGYSADIRNWFEQLVLQGRKPPCVHGSCDYGMVAQETGVPESYFAPGTPHRKLVDEQVTRLGLAESSAVDWLQEINISNQSGVPTYHDLKLHGRNYFLSTGLAPSSVNAYYSALNKWIMFFDLGAEASTEPHLGSDFQLFLLKFRSAGENRPVESRLRRWHELQFHLLNDRSLPENFAGALTLLIQRSGKDQTSIAKEVGISTSTLRGWLSGRYHPNDLEKVCQLEIALNTAPGMLTQRLPIYGTQHKRFCHIPEEWWPKGWKGRSHKHQRHAVLDQLPRHVSDGEVLGLKHLFDQALKIVENRFRENDYAERLKWQKDRPYHLKIRDWSDKLISEWQALRTYKTAPDSFANEERNNAWAAATADIFQQQLESFYGYLCLPHNSANPNEGGKGMKACDLTIGWLSLSYVVKDYLDFRKFRSGGYNTGTVVFITMLTSLLRSGSGWICRTPSLKLDLLQKQQVSIDIIDDWEEHCENTRIDLIRSLKILKRKSQINYSREPFFPISPILDLKSPLSPIVDALKFYEKELRQSERKNSKSIPAYAARWRNLLLLSLLIRLPLRSKHWRIMSYQDDNTGTLSKDSTGLWQLTLPFKDFKNCKNKKIFVGRNGEKEIVLSFAEQPLKPLVPLLELYLRDYWPTIAGDSERLFPSPTGKELTTPGLGRMVRSWTRDYLSEQSLRGCGMAGVLPFSIHAFRDILATHVIKTTDLIELAADLLLDSPEIVAKHYARFLPGDRLERVYQQLTIFDEEKS